MSIHARYLPPTDHFPGIVKGGCAYASLARERYVLGTNYGSDTDSEDGDKEPGDPGKDDDSAGRKYEREVKNMLAQEDNSLICARIERAVKCGIVDYTRRRVQNRLPMMKEAMTALQSELETKISSVSNWRERLNLTLDLSSYKFGGSVVTMIGADYPAVSVHVLVLPDEESIRVSHVNSQHDILGGSIQPQEPKEQGSIETIKSDSWKDRQTVLLLSQPTYSPATQSLSSDTRLHVGTAWELSVYDPSLATSSSNANPVCLTDVGDPW